VTITGSLPHPAAGARILCVDDDDALARAVAATVRAVGYEARVASSVAEAVDVAQRMQPDCVIADISMPDVLGTELPGRLRAIGIMAPVVMLTGEPSVDRAVAAFRGGAQQFLTKPFDPDRLLEAIREALVESPAPAPHAPGAHLVLIGQGPAMQQVRAQLSVALGSHAAVLIEGESGVGKELVARMLHYHSARADRPFVAVNCAMLEDGSAEVPASVGYGLDASGGVSASVMGVFERAADGTVLLDEITELRPAVQAKLLRVVQEQVLPPAGERPGGLRGPRIIATSNRDVQAAVAAGGFRADLYHRLNVLPIALPALAECRDDIPALVQHLITRLAAQYARRVPTVTDQALAALRRAWWPGNVRQLRNVLERAFLMSAGADITVHHLGPLLRPSPELEPSAADAPLPTLSSFDVGAAEDALIAAALRRTRGNRLRAAKLLGINARTLHRKLATRPTLDPT
jgi:two-component system response regulator AtoC